MHVDLSHESDPISAIQQAIFIHVDCRQLYRHSFISCTCSDWVLRTAEKIESNNIPATWSYSLGERETLRGLNWQGNDCRRGRTRRRNCRKRGREGVGDRTGHDKHGHLKCRRQNIFPASQNFIQMLLLKHHMRAIISKDMVWPSVTNPRYVALTFYTHHTGRWDHL